MTVRSLAAGASGIEANQTMLDTIGNNIANVNTDGYKETTAEFSDLLNQQLSPASGAAPGLASTDPSAIGSGVSVSGINTDYGEGAITQTGVPTDVAISGPGFFVVDRAGQQSYTRAGNFHLDTNGTLATADGGVVQGWMSGQPTTGPTGPITINSGAMLAPKATTDVTLTGNLPAASTSPATMTVTTYNALGQAVPVALTFTPPTSPGGSWSLSGSSGTTTSLWATPPQITFGSDGQISGVTGGTQTASGSWQIPMTVNGQTINLDLPAANTIGAVTQFAASAPSIAFASQTGNPAGTIQSWSVGNDGTISAALSNGQTVDVGRLALATFTNPGGLVSNGNLGYQASPSSGQPFIVGPGSGAAGTLMGGALEQSNVNLAAQLTDLVTAQTSYQANTKVVGTTATVLQALVSMP